MVLGMTVSFRQDYKICRINRIRKIVFILKIS